MNEFGFKLLAIMSMGCLLAMLLGFLFSLPGCGRDIVQEPEPRKIRAAEVQEVYLTNIETGNKALEPAYFNTATNEFNWTPGLMDEGVYKCEVNAAGDTEVVTITVNDGGAPSLAEFLEYYPHERNLIDYAREAKDWERP